MGAAQNLEHDGFYITGEQWQLIQDMAKRLVQVEKMLSGKKQSKLVGTGEAAQMLDICPNTLRDWHDAGKMPKNLGRGKHLKFERTAVENLAKAINTGRPRQNS